MEIIAADIGGTSSRFAHFTFSNDSAPELVEQKWLKTKDATSFNELLGQLDQSDFSLKSTNADKLVIAVAGPIREGLYCKPPNISWELNLKQSQEEIGLSHGVLINDFLAQSYSVCSPIGHNSQQLLNGEAVVEGTIAVLGAGTGLGKAFLVADGSGGYLGAASEGGHGSFATESEEEIELFRFLSTISRGNYPTWEELVSGSGLSRIHQFLTGEQLEPADVTKTFGADSITLQWAARMYGRVCRNFALEVLASGGMYIAGGVAAKNPALVSHPAFAESFHNSAVHRSLLEKIPVLLIDDESSGLWGSAYYCWQQTKRLEPQLVMQSPHKSSINP